MPKSASSCVAFANAARMNRRYACMRGMIFVSTPLSAAIASLTEACAVFTAVSASAKLWRAGTSVAVVYATFPSVNCPFGKCFSVPAMSACTRAKVFALLAFVVVVVGLSSFPEGRAMPEWPAGPTVLWEPPAPLRFLPLH